MTPVQPNVTAEHPAPGSIGIDGGDYLLSVEDLPVLSELIGVRSNRLSLLPPAQPVAGQNERLTADFARLDEVDQRRVAIALAVLAAPAKVAWQHNTIADETTSRCALAWSASLPDSIIALASAGGLRRVSFCTAGVVKASITKTLAAEQKLSDDRVGCKLPSLAVLTLLAILDQLRAVRLYSLLKHSQPDTTFSPSEIMERLAGAAVEDFRWPLNFVDKVLPGLARSLTQEDVAAAIQELIRAELVEAVIETELSKRYDLTETGKVISAEVLHDVTKVALSLCDQRPDGKFGHDLALWIRGPFHLLLFAMAGQQGAVAAVNNDELDDLLSRALAFTPAVKTAVEQPPAQSAPAPSAAAAVCLRCGGSIRPGLRFCEQCGQPVAPEPAVPAPRATPRFCPGCGHPAAPDMRFCGNCGGPLG
jgi:hypothetical protein